MTINKLVKNAVCQIYDEVYVHYYMAQIMTDYILGA